MSNDPTFQKQGMLRVLFRNDSNWSWLDMGKPRGIPVAFNSIEYEPQGRPPPRWGAQQYRTQDGEAPRFGTNMGDQSLCMGCFEAIDVLDMSNQSVVSGCQYLFRVTILPEIQLFFMITGVNGGAVVLPGFGLFNLDTRPNAWTYITPEEVFTGYWQIGVLTPSFGATAWLSVENSPSRQYHGGPGQASLIFSISGNALIDSPLSAGREHAAPALDGVCYLNEARSSPYAFMTR